MSAVNPARFKSASLVSGLKGGITRQSIEFLWLDYISVLIGPVRLFGAP
jgi:hypothetical protein